MTTSNDTLDQAGKGMLGLVSGAATGGVVGAAIMGGTVFVGGVALCAIFPVAAPACVGSAISQAVAGGVTFTTMYGTTAAVTAGAAGAAVGGVGGAIHGVQSKNKTEALTNGATTGAACGAVVGGAAAASVVAIAAVGTSAQAQANNTTFLGTVKDNVRKVQQKDEDDSTVSKSSSKWFNFFSNSAPAPSTSSSTTNAQNNGVNDGPNLQAKPKKTKIELKYKSMVDEEWTDKQRKRQSTRQTNSLNTDNLRISAAAAVDAAHAYVVVTDLETGQKVRYENGGPNDYGRVMYNRFDGYDSPGEAITLVSKHIDMNAQDANNVVQQLQEQYKQRRATYDLYNNSCQTFASEAFNATTGETAEHLVNKKTIKMVRGAQWTNDNKVPLGAMATIASIGTVVAGNIRNCGSSPSKRRAQRRKRRNRKKEPALVQSSDDESEFESSESEYSLII